MGEASGRAAWEGWGGGTLQGLIGYLSSVSEEFHNLVEYAGKSITAPSDSQEDSACTLAVCPASGYGMQECLCLLEVGRVKPFGKPVIDPGQ